MDGEGVGRYRATGRNAVPFNHVSKLVPTGVPTRWPVTNDGAIARTMKDNSIKRIDIQVLG